MKNIAFQNQYVRSATAMGLCDMATGEPTEEFFAYYRELARGGIGMVINEHAFVDMRGHAAAPQLGIHTDEMTRFHKRQVDEMRAEDPKLIICCQISHASVFSNQEHPLDVNTASVEELSAVVESFKNAARRAQEAGYDCIQIHAAHGYLLSRSLSSLLNSRSDYYAADSF